MNQLSGPQVHPFYSGKAQASIADALEQDRRDSAQVQDNLYVVSIRDAHGGRVGVVPRHLAAMMPRMKASDYDYIIFDMPPVSQTSPTSKVAGLMDMVFMVVESERTNAELVRQANTLLAESRSNVTVLLNKYRPYLPKRCERICNELHGALASVPRDEGHDPIRFSTTDDSRQAWSRS